MHTLLEIEIGSLVRYSGNTYKITKRVDLDIVLCKNIKTHELEKIHVSQLLPHQVVIEDNNAIEIESISEKDWEVAKKKFELIKPILESRDQESLIKEIADKSGKGVSTLYRWISQYESTNSLVSLVERTGRGAPGKSRLSKEVLSIVESCISDFYLANRQKSVQSLINEIKSQCYTANLTPPHDNTIRNQVGAISEKLKMKKRKGAKATNESFRLSNGSFPGGTYPLEHVQIDHTKLDIILVDESSRLPVGRPWITLAIDIYSRMVVGFYISFDPPGLIGTGLCIAHSILPKEKWLAKYSLEAEWPVWGIMNTIHVDNAKEFKGDGLLKSCSNYGINIEFRPVKRPQYGGHVERLLGTTLSEIHNLPGTTFSNTEERKDYDSEKKAALTIKELEKWLLIFFTKVYHQRIHSSLNTSPQSKYKQGVLGDSTIQGVGVQPRITEEFELKLGFMPYFERHIQQSGIVIDYIHYRSDILAPYVNSMEKGPGQRWVRRKFLFRRDPRNIKTIYFWHPDHSKYYEVPYADITLPAVSIWEFRAALKRVKELGKKDFSEREIFTAYSEMKDIEDKSTNLTKSIRRKSKKNNSDAIVNKPIHSKPKSANDDFSLDFDLSDIEPFEVIEDATKE